MKVAIEKYGVGIKDEDVYDLSNNPKATEVNDTIVKIKRRL